MPCVAWVGQKSWLNSQIGKNANRMKTVRPLSLTQKQLVFCSFDRLGLWSREPLLQQLHVLAKLHLQLLQFCSLDFLSKLCILLIDLLLRPRIHSCHHIPDPVTSQGIWLRTWGAETRGFETNTEVLWNSTDKVQCKSPHEGDIIQSAGGHSCGQ